MTVLGLDIVFVFVFIPGGLLRCHTTKRSSDSHICMVLNCFQSSFTFYLIFFMYIQLLLFPVSTAVIPTLLKTTFWGYLVSFVLPDWFRTDHLQLTIQLARLFFLLHLSPLLSCILLSKIISCLLMLLYSSSDATLLIYFILFNNT